MNPEKLIDNEEFSGIIRPVNDKLALKAFLDCQRQIYRNDPHWVPPLLKEERDFLGDKNPYVRDNPVRLFIATQNGRVVGRIAATVNAAHNQYHSDKVGFFGFFECENDKMTASALLDAAAGFLRENGMETMRGPFNFSTNHTCGLLIDGFDSPPVVDMTYNPSYYEDLLENGCGLSRAKDLVAYWIDLRQEIRREKVLQAVVERAKKYNVTVRNLRYRGAGLKEDIASIEDLYHRSWKDNWGYVPTSKEEYTFLVKRLMQVVEPDMGFIAEISGEAVGFSLAIPDYNPVLKALDGRLSVLGLIRAYLAKRRIDVGRLIMIGVPEDQRHGLLAIPLVYRTMKCCQLRGYRGMEASWILEDNFKANQFLAKHMGLDIYKTYRIYEKPI